MYRDEIQRGRNRLKEALGDDAEVGLWLLIDRICNMAADHAEDRPKSVNTPNPPRNE